MSLIKQPRLEGIFECCICTEKGLIGYANVHQLSLREGEFTVNFSDLIFFTLGFNVQEKLSDICQNCKTKIVEFYHFKIKSQNAQKKFSPLLQEIMKIVGNYICLNDIKAVTIEENKERLIIMEKIPNSCTNLKISTVSSSCNVQIKDEQDNVNDSQNSLVEIKREPEDVPDISDFPDGVGDVSMPNDSLDSKTPGEKLDWILTLNKQILDTVQSLKQQHKDNLINKSFYEA